MDQEQPLGENFRYGFSRRLLFFSKALLAHGYRGPLGTDGGGAVASGTSVVNLCWLRRIVGLKRIVRIWSRPKLMVTMCVNGDGIASVCSFGYHDVTPQISAPRSSTSNDR